MAIIDNLVSARATEDDLCQVWLSQSWRAGSTTMPYDVIFPGRQLGIAGPDFRDALISDRDGHVLAGDIELHVNSHEWFDHQHHTDPAYNNVVIHVVLQDDGQPCMLANGRVIPTLTLWPLLRSALPKSGPPVRGTCCIGPAVDGMRINGAIQAAGRQRIETKAAQCEADSAAMGAEQALFQVLLQGAGYGANKSACRLLAQTVPIDRLLDILSTHPDDERARVATAIVLGLAGLLRSRADAEAHVIWERYADYWPLPPLPSCIWRRTHVRPNNTPDLRIQGIAAIIARATSIGLAAYLLAPIGRVNATQLVDLLCVNDDQGQGLIGDGRAVEIAINAVIPFALAVARNSGDIGEDSVWTVAEQLHGGEDSSPARQMRQILQDAGHRLKGRSALDAQGLLHIYKTYCVTGTSWDCPLHLSS